MQVKRIHEYKRQLLFALYIIAGYTGIKDNPDSRIGAADLYLRRQSRAGLSHGQADHPADQLRRATS